MKSKFSRVITRILRFFKAIITWLSERLRVRKVTSNSIDIELDYDNDAEVDVSVSIVHGDNNE